MIDDNLPLIPRAVSISSVRVTIPAFIVKARQIRSGDKIKIRIEPATPDAAEAVEFCASVRKTGVVHYFTVPASIWPAICNMGYGTDYAVPMQIEREDD